MSMRECPVHVIM